MTTPDETGPMPPVTRRERLRREVLEEIKRSARELLVPHTTGELSLRAVARDVGIAPSGIYRYFASRQDLVAAVAADAYASAAGALEASLERTVEAPCAVQALALAHAHRRWCLEHRAEFSLIFGTQAGTGDSWAVLEAEQLHSFFRTPLRHFARGVRDGGVDTGRATLPTGSPLAADLALASAEHETVLDVRQVAVLVSGWASIHGFVSLEVYGPLSWLFADVDDAFDQHARGVLAAMGYLGLEDVAALTSPPAPGDAAVGGPARPAPPR